VAVLLGFNCRHCSVLYVRKRRGKGSIPQPHGSSAVARLF